MLSTTLNFVKHAVIKINQARGSPLRLVEYFQVYLEAELE